MTNVDTNYFLRWLIGDVPDQASTADAFFRNAEDKTINLTSAVLAEIVYGLRSYGYERKAIVQAIIAALELECLACDKLVFASSLQLFGSNKLDFVDCYLIADAVAHNKQLATFDKKMRLEYKRTLQNPRFLKPSQ